MRKYLSIGVALLQLLSAVPRTLGQEWTIPFFSDPSTDGVEFTSVDGPPNYPHHQMMNVREELTVPFNLAIINYEGTTAPTITQFYVGDRNVLNPSFVPTPDGKWYLQVNGRLDYESIDPDISFELTIATFDETVIKPRISLTLQNIFDNPPRFDSDGECLIDELEPPHLTDCTYTLYDADGMLNNQHTFRIEGSNGEEKLFEFVAGERISSYEVRYRLQTNEELKFEERELYSFKVNVSDISNNSAESRIIVAIEDIPDLPPKWIKSFVSDRFDEKLQREYTVQAIDGDTKINKDVYYALRFEDPDQDWTQQITIGQMDGILTITPLNRDVLKQEVFNFYIIAYENDDFGNQTESSATIILNDVNDNLPLLTVDTATIHIWESTFETLKFDQFFANDIDLGQNAQYTVELMEVAGDSLPYSTAFTIIPSAGYQESKFIVSVTNAQLLDYEDESWREFSVKVRAVEDIDNTRFDEKTFRVALDNWNDEEPIFDAAAYSFSVPESIGMGELLGRVHADDRDFGDRVEYSIVGYLSDQIRITEDGELMTNVDELLDYERQTNVVMQIAAKDTLVTDKPGEVLHTTYVQFTIDVLDVNDETPELRMPRTTPSIKENSEKGSVVTDGIIATDLDTTATLVLEILWDDSYATKNGRRVEPEEYIGCFIIEADTTNRNEVKARILINPDFEYAVDYEKYEVLYLSIYVNDTATELGVPDASGMITIQIEDENDNPPEFVAGTADVNRTVIEASLAQTVIGSIIATDADGPGNNDVHYFIEPLDDTPDWVNIGVKTGDLTVIESNEIDCDVPPRLYLTYRITATDLFKENFIDIGIFIIDTNNREPDFVDFIESVAIYENQTEGLVVSVSATDEDRDLQHRDFQFNIDFTGNQNQNNLFGIDVDSGDLVVELKNGLELDRDEGLTEHGITIVVTDFRGGLGTTNSKRRLVTVVLKDVNDNAPVLPSRANFQPKVVENIFTGTLETQEITDTRLLATDKDEGAHGEVSFRIISIVAYEDTANPAPDIEGVFEIKSERNLNRGTLVITKSLRGFYGTWEIEIEAYDHGDEGDSRISLSSREKYLLEISPFNFNTPEITFPSVDQTIRLRYPQNINSQLYLFTNTELSAFTAVDEDGGIYGQVEFKITGSWNDEDHQYFGFVRDGGTNRYQLQMVQATEDKIYLIDIAAEDGGGLKDEITSLKIVFVNQFGSPVYSENTFQATITENDAGATVQLRTATDPKNEGITDPSELFEINYFLQSPSDFFSVDKKTAVLSLKQALEWTEETETHELIVIATNDEVVPANPDENSMLKVTITVEDVNDKPPQFELARYGAGITTDDPVDKAVLTVRAIDPDKDDVVTYFYLEGTMDASPSLSSVKDIAFSINQQTGQVVLQIKVLESYSGYFTFTIQARDLVGHTDDAIVRVYIIAESNRVSFLFWNAREDVEEHSAFIGTVLGRHFNYDCYVDDVQLYDASTIQVRVHFVNDDIAVDGDVIRGRSNDVELIAEIKKEMIAEGLNLYLIITPTGDVELSNKEDLLIILLIVVSVVFATICSVLIVAFILRTRSLNRQLKAFSTTDFGSVSSNLNRREAPTTNVFSVEGSNPVLQNHNMGKTMTMFDEESIQSDDSDMIGFEDHPDFVKKGINANGNAPRESVNVARIQDVRQNIKNPMANGTMTGNDGDNDSLTRF